MSPRSARNANDSFLRSEAVATSALTLTGECASAAGSASATPTRGSRNGKFTWHGPRFTPTVAENASRAMERHLEAFASSANPASMNLRTKAPYK